MRIVVCALIVAGFCATLVADDAQPQAPQADQVVLQFTVLEIDRARLTDECPELAAALYLNPELIPSVETDQSLLRWLKRLVGDKGAVKVITEPTLAVPLGQTAEYRQGGEFEIPVPAQDQRLAGTAKKFYGDYVKAKVDRRGNQLQVEFLFQSSQLNQANAVKFNGKPVPGLSMITFETSVDCQPGETQLLTRRCPALSFLPAENEKLKTRKVLAVFLEIESDSDSQLSQR